MTAASLARRSSFFIVVVAQCKTSSNLCTIVSLIKLCLIDVELLRKLFLWFQTARGGCCLTHMS